MWKLIYELATIKVGEEDPFKGRDNEGGKVEKDVEVIEKKEGMAKTDEQQEQ